MNLFQKYGIKEVADVVFYSITTIGDETIYTPVLYLDTLKISTLEGSSEKVSAKGGKGNKKLISWNFGKEMSLSLEDALFTPASMSMIWGGKLNAKLSDYTSAIVKMNIANKYGSFHYSTKAYASPTLTDEEWNLVFKAATEEKIPCPEKVGDDTVWYLSNIQLNNDQQAYVKENQVKLKRSYLYRLWPDNDINSNGLYRAMPKVVIDKILTYIDNLNKLGYIDTNNYDIEVIDRFEKCVVREKRGLRISTQQQKDNLLRYYADDKSSSYTIIYDEKTMLPLFHIENGDIQGWNSEEDLYFTLKFGTPYLKWTRTVKYKDGDNDSLGKVLVIDAETFSGDYKIVGETWIREQKTGKDQRYQFSINRAQISADTSLTLEADGDPTTFDMTVDVLTPQNGEIMEFKQINVDDDIIFGGTRVMPQRAQYTYTNTTIDNSTSIPNEIYNDEII